MKPPPFSRRLAWELPPNRMAGALSRLREQSIDLIDLTESNPTQCGLEYPNGEILDALSAPASLRYEPTPTGLAAAREAVAQYYNQRKRPAPGAGSLAVRPAIERNQIVLSASTSESYGWLFKLLCDAGDAVFIPRPSYPLFEHLGGLEGIVTRAYSLRFGQDGWMIDFPALERELDAGVRAIVVVNPNNPTGSLLRATERERLVEICAGRGMALISDEVFSDYLLDPLPGSVVSLAGESRVLTFSLSGLSKVAGLPQMKAGWMVVSGPAAPQANALARLELIADTYLSVSAPAQHALPRWLESGAAVQKQILRRIRGNLAELKSRVNAQQACVLLPVEGGWCATLRLPQIRSDEDWALDLLEAASVIVQPGYFYDFAQTGYVVLSLLTEPEHFREGVARLLQRVNETLGGA